MDPSRFQAVVSNIVVCAFKAYWSFIPFTHTIFHCYKGLVSSQYEAAVGALLCCSVLMFDSDSTLTLSHAFIVVDSALFLLLKSLEVGFKVPKLWD